MTLLEELLPSEPRIVSVLPTDTIRTAVKAMADANCGSTMVMDGGRLLGIFTERDLVKRVVPQDVDLDRTPIRQVMSTELVLGRTQDSLGSTILAMQKHHIRHLPVVDQDGTLRGVLSIRDLIRQDLREMREYLALTEG